MINQTLNNNEMPVLHYLNAHQGFDAPKEFHCKKDMRKWSRFFYLIKGKVLFRLENETDLILNEGEILYIPYNCPYTSHWVNSVGATYYSLQFILKNTDGEILDLFSEICKIPILTAQTSLSFFNEIINCYLLKPTNYQFKTQELFWRFLGLQNHIQTSRSREIIKPGIQYLTANYIENINVENLAKLCNVSVSTFSHYFKETMGTSVVQYRNKLRIEKAFELIVSTDFSIQEIAERVNIPNINHFNNLFSRRYSITPGKARQILLKTK